MKKVKHGKRNKIILKLALAQDWVYTQVYRPHRNQQIKRKYKDQVNKFKVSL